jgi:Flp pilus assembly protein TadB
MSTVWQPMIVALWATGTALVLLPWLTWALSRWRESNTERVLLSLVRPTITNRSAWRELPWLRRLTDELEIAEIRLPMEALLGFMVFFGVVGWFVVEGAIVGLQQRYALDGDRLVQVNAWMLNGISAILIGSLPYFYVKFRLQHKRHRIALDMIKLVQNFIGHYNSGRTIQEMISRSSDTMPEAIRSEWKRLEVGAHMQTSLEEALFTFARRTDNVWAEDLADILIIKHKYGNDVMDALHKLMIDMQVARRNEERRLAMVTVYRIGTSIMIGFAFFIVYFNVFADGTNYKHYFISPMGRTLLLCSAAVLFVSLMMVVRTGRRSF